MTQSDKPATLHYKRSHFATQLPVDYLYTPSHFWIAREPDGVCRVGLTKFASRMLGETVDHGFETEPESEVRLGQIVGWIEGFKAIADLFCVAEGRFLGGNPILKEQIALSNTEPYGAGWLYKVRGQPDPQSVDVHGYKTILDKTIERILQKQAGEQIQ